MSIGRNNSPRVGPEDPIDDLTDFVRRPIFTDGEITGPATDVSEDDDEVTVRMEVPGIEKDDLQVTVFEDRVTIRGEARANCQDTGKTFYRQEIPYGPFQRTVPLPVEVDASKATATLENGILSISLPKNAHPTTRGIEVVVV